MTSLLIFQLYKWHLYLYVEKNEFYASTHIYIIIKDHILGFFLCLMLFVCWFTHAKSASHLVEVSRLDQF